MDELEKIFAELQLLFVQQRNQINELKSRAERDFNNVLDKRGFKIVKKVLYYIEHGIEEKQALLLVCDENDDLPPEYILKVWKVYRPQKSGLLLYARCYTAHKMKQAGFKTAEIAATLGLSITTTKKILNQKIVLD